GNIVPGLQDRKDEPIVIGESRGHEKSPNRQHRSDVLGMFEERERKPPAPGNIIAEPVAIEDADFAQSEEHPYVEHLPDRDEDGAQPDAQVIVPGRDDRAVPVDVAPAEENRKLKRLEADKEISQHV